jgi:hypothetical protein
VKKLHMAPGAKWPTELHTTIYGLNLASHFCNLLARVYKVRPFCSWDSAFGHESVLAQ